MSDIADLSSVELTLIESVSEAQDFLTWMGQSRPMDVISIDIETGELPGRDKKDALSSYRGRIRTVQVGDSRKGWTMAWDEWAGVFYQAMEHWKGLIVFHNIAFEASWFANQSRWNLPWAQAHDTMLMARLMDPQGSAALKVVSSRVVDNRAAVLQRMLDEGMVKNGWTWGTVPVNFHPYWAYGALDTVITCRIFEHFWEHCAPGQVYGEAYELELQTRKIATKMELNGAPVDLEYSARMLDELVDKTDKIKAWAKKYYHGLSITSNIQLVRQFESMDVEITEFTKTGNKSMTKDQLMIIMRDGNLEAKQLAKYVLEQRKADKLASSYFSNFLGDNINGILHPSINTLAARTHRMSITNPALQTLPSKDPLVRRAFIPKDEDHSIIASDLDQVEFRITASLSQDAALIKLFNDADASGGDVFTDIMRQVYHDDSLVKADPRRGLIKGVVYGKLYGAGVDKMAVTAGVSSKDMREVVNAFDGNYPGVKQLQKSIENEGMRRLKKEGEGYILTKTGRRLPSDGDRVYSLTNYLVQGSAAEIFKQNLVKLDQADMTDFMVVPVHDEIVLQVPTADAEEIKHVVQQCMTTTAGWPIPLTSGVDGPFDNWGQKYEK